MAGETPDSTFYASSHFLETLGCRWFFSNPIGTVIPTRKTIAVDALAIEEMPDFLMRRMWGPNWRDQSWQLHNRTGGLSLPTGHDWAHVPAATYAAEHPEYYALRGEERRPGNWLCTANPDVGRIFAESIVEEVKGKGAVGVSVSPPDGRGYCQCDACTALDDAQYTEPSSGHVCISDRYQRFYNAVGRTVLEANPEAILNYYAYADYSRPPKHVRDSPPNLCAWVAPIRYCRLHSLASPICEPRQRLRRDVGEWQEAVSKLGWREYNYNLAELIAPFSKVSIWREDLPYLHRAGCIGVSIECLFHWHIYGPHTYLAARLMWDADADVDAIMDDFYTTFCGAAAPHVKAYWDRIDAAYRETDIHVGSFYGLHVVWTPELVAACEADMAKAAAAADSDVVKQRVEMFRMGLENIKYYLALREATSRTDFVAAKDIYDTWLAHMDDVHARKIHRIGEYKQGYVPRFLGKPVLEGYARVTGGNRKVVQLPDEWMFRHDPEGKGQERGWDGAEVADEGWQRVRTHSATLAEQGVEEVLTWMWYRTEFELPAVAERQALFLWFAEIDGLSTAVFVNGQAVGETTMKRKPFEFDVSAHVRKGRNIVAVRIDHSSISELSLGGIIKPVMVYAGPERGANTQ